MKRIEAITLVLSRRLPADDTLPLPSLELDAAGRERTRLRVEVEGKPYAILLDPGPALLHGELLADINAPRLRVSAAAEAVALAITEDPFLRTRAAWHLGNRHTAVQFVDDAICFRPDHVLEAMLVGLGLSVRHEQRPFLPESGAYHGTSGGLVQAGGGSHHHPHSHGHSHDV